MELINTTILRHPKERLSKCSLQPLVGREGLRFIRAKSGLRIDVSGFTILAVDASELSEEDAGRPLMLLDSTWRLLPDLEKCLEGEPVRRSLPKDLVTAYPRVSKISEDPFGGLASVEALYAAQRLLGVRDDSLLDNYHWKAEFLRQYKD